MILREQIRRGQAAAKEFVAVRLRLVATMSRYLYATSPDRNTGPLAGPFRRAWNPHNPAAARHLKDHRNRQQAFGREPDLAQGAENRCQRQPQHRVPDSSTAEAPGLDRRTRPDAHQWRGALLRAQTGARPYPHGLPALRQNYGICE